MFVDLNRRGRRARTLFATGAALLGLIGSIALASPAVADDPDDPLAHVTVDLAKTVSQSEAEAGDQLSYTISVNCASTIADCVNLQITDTIPSPFVLGSVALSGGSEAGLASVAYDVTDHNKFVVSFIDDLGEGRKGLQAGVLYNFAVTASVPEDVSADYDGAVVTNTAYATLDNFDSNKDASADVTLSVPLLLHSSVGKSFSESDVSSIPGYALSFDLTAANTSNTTVDSLVIEDATADAFTYLGVTGVTVAHWPAGADTVQTDWFDGTDWHTSAPDTEVVLPLDTSLIKGLRFSFFSTTGGIARAASGTVTVDVSLRDSVVGITGSALVTNTATSWVTKFEVLSTPVAATDTLTITKAEISPVATKHFSTTSIVGGKDVTVTLGASNGGKFTLQSMTITEPAPSTPTLVEQGLGFGGFVASDIEWPVGAAAASISYLYDGDTDFSDPISTTDHDTLPGPDPDRTVAGFSVTFTGTLLKDQYAVVPFYATTAAVEADVTTTNTIQVDVTTSGGLTASTTANDAITTRTARINTSVRKVATPTTVYSVAGAYSIVSLPGQIDPVPTDADDFGGSTVGSQSLTITDHDPTFWDYFNISRILPTSVSSGITLTVEYFDGTDWVQFDTNSTAVGPVSYSRTLSADEQAAAAGIRFIFTPTSPTEVLEPGFAVQPNLRVALRSSMRSDADTPAANPDAPENVTVGNTALSTAVSSSATPTTVEDTATASLTLLPVPSGPGINFFEKQWLDETVAARSGDEVTTVLHWGTGNLPFDSVTISDTDDPTVPVAQTVYEAFDLTEIPAITSTIDPQLTYDEITAVQLYIGGAWVDTDSNPCAGGACDGAFPGYTLTATEASQATGVRLIFEESPTRSERVGDDPSAPPVGSGVASAYTLERDIRLVFTIRDVRRSDASVPVLGSTRAAVYNAGADNVGVVINTAGFVGTAPDGSTRTDIDGDHILILDQAITVTATKSWTGGPLGTPPDGTPEQLYPTARMTLTAKNTSLARVDHLTLTEPSSRVIVNPFEYVNLTDIVSITVPSGPTATVTLQPSGDTFTVDQAEDLTRAELADVTGISIALDGIVASQDQIRIVADTQLRADSRTLHEPIAAQQLDNEVDATIVDSGGSQIPVSGTNNIVTAYASDHVDIEVFSYGASITKTLIADTTATDSTPATQYADTTKATVRLVGQPTGNVRTTTMIFEDTDASFWNAYDFSGFPTLQFATPINRVQVDVLVGIDYVLGSGNSISYTCGTSDCWVEGTPSATPTLPAGVSAADVRGIRFTFTRSDYAAWERPFNPLQTVDFVVERRTNLVEPAGEPVPSTLFTFTDQAPGEPVIGTYNNDATIEVNSALSASDTHPLWSATDQDSSAITFQHLPAKVSISKSQYGPQSLGVDLPFDLTIKNTGGVHNSPLTGVTIVDQLPVDGSGAMLVIPTDPETGLILPASAAFTYSLLNSSGVESAAPSVTAVYDDAEHPTRVTFTLNQTLALGFSLVIHSPLQFRPLLGAAVEATNGVTVTADQPFDECRGTVDTQWTDPTTYVFSCAASTTVWPLPSSPMTIVKSVRGIEAGPLDADGNKLIDPLTSEPFDDLGVLRTTGTSSCENPTTSVPGRTELFYRYPCVPITRPGAEEEWGARFYNSGNISIKQLVAIDVLPAPGDRGVIIDEARSSKWAAKLSSYPEVTGVPVGTTYTVYYLDQPEVATPLCNGADIQLTMGMTTATEPPILNTPQYRGCLTPAGNALAVPRPWTILDPGADAATLASVVAMKIDVRIPDAGLAPGAAIGVLYRTLTANQQAIKETNTANLYRDSIAYNSIAGAAVGINVDKDGHALDLAYRFVTEPRKVGVALATGKVQLSKLVTGAAASYATSTFNLELSCESNGDPVALTLFSGADRNPFPVGAGSTVDVYGVPLYSTCSLGESHNYGATTVTPSSGVRVLAQHSAGSSTVFDPHPAFDERPEVLTATVVNDYPAASLTVSKTVETNGAVDQDGAAIAYKPALASVTCTFDNGTGVATVLSKTNEQLIPGTPLVYPGLPAGALCTVTETDQRGATTTSTVTTAAGTVAGGASPAQFTLTPGANSTAFANDFGVGSLRVTKVVNGTAAAEAWAAGPFTIQVTCTNPNTVATQVYSKSITLSRTVTEYLISNLPTGSTCVTTEPQPNGATSTTLPSNVVITRAEQSATVTNTFSYARLTVSKTVTTTAVDGSGTAVKPGPFSFSVVCTFTHAGTTDTVLATGFTASPMTFSLTGGTSQALLGMPAGTTCVVTEDTPVGSPTTSITTDTGSTSPATVTGLTATINSLTADSGSTGTNTAVVTNTYAVGSLKITKALKGGASTQFGGSQSFQFLVTCTSPGVTGTYTKTVSRTGAGTITVSNILAGSTCSVSESNSASTGADAVVILNGSNSVITGTGLTINGGSQTAVTFQNWYLTGQVTVTKTVDGPGAAFGTGPFTVHLVCSRGGQSITIAGGADRTLTNGSSTTYTLLPRGASCTLTETNTYGAGSTVITNGTFTVAVDTASLTDNQVQPAISVTNTFQLASLVVSKQVVSSAANQDGTLITYGPFDMQVKCTFQGNLVRATGFGSDIMTFTLADAASRTLSGLPAGATCEVTETNVHGAARTSITTVSGGGAPATTAGATASVTLVTAATNSAAVKNEYDSGSLTLSKVVAGLAGAQYGGGTFTVDVECVLAEGNQVVWSKSYSVTGTSDPILLSPIAAGAVCSVTETDSLGATSIGITVDAGVSKPNGSNVTIPAANTAVVVTNTFDYASIDVFKTVVSDAVDEEGLPVYPGGSFDIEVECEFLGQTVLAAGFAESPMAFSIGHAEHELLTGLPAGASCDVTEVSTVQADSTSISTSTASVSHSVDGTTATIASITRDNSSATNTAEITNRYGVTSFTVEKVLEGDASEQFGVGPFDIHVVCIAPGNVSAYDDTVSLPIDGDWFVTINDIPNGSICMTDETNFDQTGADARATLDADGNPVTSTTVTLEAPGHVYIHNWYLTGAVDVTKLVTGAGGAKFGTGPFTVSIECYVGETKATLPDDTQSFVDGETVTFHGLPSGANCTLTETDAAGAHTSAIVLASSGATLAENSFTVAVDTTDLVDDQAQPALRVDNDFPVSNIVITKTVHTEAVDDQGVAVEYGPFPVTVTCELASRAVYATGYDAETPMATDLVDGEPFTLEALPVGAACVITETNAKDAVATSITTSNEAGTLTTEATTAEFTLDESDTTISVDNSYDVGSVTLSKRVWGDGADAWGTAVFTITLECTLTDSSGTRTVYTASHDFRQGDEPVTYSNIASGASCVVTETDTGAATATAITIADGEPTDGTSAEFDIDGEVAVEVANRFDTTSVVVDKVREGFGAELWGAGPFEVTLTCSFDGEPIEIPEGNTRPLEAPDYSARFDGLPVGADCAMAETEFGGANGSTVSPQIFGLTGEAADVTVSNVFNEGDLTVVKHVTGDGVGVDLWGSGPFEVSLECTRWVNGAEETIEIPDGATRPLNTDNDYVASYTHLPQGASCVVTETIDGEATSTVIEPGSIEILDSETVTVDVTNTFTIGSLQIIKTASQPVVQADDEFDYTFEVSNTGTVPAAGVKVVDDIPALLKVIDVNSDDWSDCSVADTDTFGYGGVLTCYYDETLPAGESATAFTITVVVHPDIQVDTIDNVAVVTSTTRGVTGDDDDERVLVKWLDVSSASECVLDAPWMTYAIDVHNLDTTGHTLTATWRDGSGTVIHTDDIPLDGGPVEGKLLWPGAEVNADGVGIAWPGWRAALPGETPEFENLVLDPTLPNYGLREHTEVTFSINPSATVTVEYPIDGAVCDEVERDPGLWITKVASAPIVAAGGTFDYAITVGNDGLGAVQDLALIDPIPASLKVLDVTPAAAASDDLPAWESCEVTDRLPNGYGGTVTCLLDRPLGYKVAVPIVTLHVQLDPTAPVGSITNVATVTATGTGGAVVLSAKDSAVILTPGMLALTGLVIGGSVLPVALGLLLLGGLLIAVRLTPRRQRRH